jgi:hypothetical protein
MPRGSLARSAAWMSRRFQVRRGWPPVHGEGPGSSESGPSSVSWTLMQGSSRCDRYAIGAPRGSRRGPG